MTPDPHIVLSLAGKIVEAENHLAELRQSWESLFANVPHGENNTRSIRSKRDTGFTRTLEDALNAEPDKTFTIPDLADQLKTDTIKLGRTLFRLSSTGKIESRGRGLYGAKRQLAIVEVKAA